ncbi:MAG: amidohydrolase family protein, partial [Clostridia bacterium]|nr:amidohydrolase family protein [Clostridia bacterium]
MNGMVIDVHAHIFPDAIAEKASVSIAKFYDIPVEQGGSVDRLLKLGDEAGIDKFVVHSVAMTPAHVQSVLKFITASVKAHPDRFIGFGSLHPDMENAGDAVKQMMDAGLRGVKLHPDMQLFALDEDRAYRMFESFAGKLPLLVHAGDKRYQFSNPHRIA